MPTSQRPDTETRPSGARAGGAAGIVADTTGTPARSSLHARIAVDLAALMAESCATVAEQMRCATRAMCAFGSDRRGDKRDVARGRKVGNMLIGTARPSLRNWNEANARVCDGVGTALDRFIRRWEPAASDDDDVEAWRIQLQAVIEEEIEAASVARGLSE